MAKTNTDDFASELAAADQQIAAARQRRAEIERAQRHAAGVERRARLSAVGEDAQVLIDRADETTTEINQAAAAVTEAVRHLADLVDHNNTAVSDLHRRIAAELKLNREQRRFIPAPPSPADSGVGIDGASVLVGTHRLGQVDARSLIERAVTAGHEPRVDTPTVPPFIVTANFPAGPFWRSRASGNVLHADQRPNADCDEILQIEFLSAAWGIPIRDLPPAMLEGLTPVERARLATALLPDGGDAA